MISSRAPPANVRKRDSNPFARIAVEIAHLRSEIFRVERRHAVDVGHPDAHVFDSARSYELAKHHVIGLRIRADDEDRRPDLAKAALAIERLRALVALPDTQPYLAALRAPGLPARSLA